MRELFVLLLSFWIGCESVSMLSDGGRSEVVRLSVSGTDLSVEVRKTHAHSFLAEYDFTLVLKRGSREIGVQKMTGDTGGRSRIDIVKVSANHYEFRDYAKTVCFNVAERKLGQFCDARSHGVRIGHLDFDDSRRWRYIAESGGVFLK